MSPRQGSLIRMFEPDRILRNGKARKQRFKTGIYDGFPRDLAMLIAIPEILVDRMVTALHLLCEHDVVTRKRLLHRLPLAGVKIKQRIVRIKQKHLIHGHL